jgi:hypothetical protein
MAGVPSPASDDPARQQHNTLSFALTFMAQPPLMTMPSTSSAARVAVPVRVSRASSAASTTYRTADGRSDGRACKRSQLSPILPSVCSAYVAGAAAP